MTLRPLFAVGAFILAVQSWSSACLGQSIEPLVPKQNFATLNSAQLALLSIDDLTLREAYAQLFLQRMGTKAPWQDVVAQDLRRRGDAAVPILFELFVHRPDFREELLFAFHDFANLPAASFLPRVREMVKDDRDKLSRRTCAAISVFLEGFGTSEDVHVMESLIAHDPEGEKGEITWKVSRHLAKLKKRLETEKK